MHPEPASLRRYLGSVATTSQSLATIGLTITAVVNIPAALAAGSGSGTWMCYAIALLVILLVVETLVLFRHHQARASGIAGYVAAGLGARHTGLAAWALMLGYGAVFVACVSFFGAYFNALLAGLQIAGSPLLLSTLAAVLCIALARCDVKLSAVTMLVVETISVLLVMALCVLVLSRIGAAAQPVRLAALPTLSTQLHAGLMVAIFSFIGFESAANLGEEVHQPEHAIPRALRSSVLLAGVIFLFWAVVISVGVAWLPPMLRTSVDPVGALSRRLDWPSAALLVDLGASLSLFGASLGGLSAMGRVVFNLAQRRLLPGSLAVVHGRFGTPASALLGCGLIGLLVGVAGVQSGLSPQQLYDNCGSVAVLAFLLVYGLVAISALRRNLPGVSVRRRRWMAGSCLVVVLAVAVAETVSLAQSQSLLLGLFTAVMAVGAWRLAREPG